MTIPHLINPTVRDGARRLAALAGALTTAVVCATACAQTPKADAAERAPAPDAAPGQSARDARIANPVGLFIVGADQDMDLATGLAELETALAQAHQRFDASADGVLSPIEYAKFAEACLGHIDAFPTALMLDPDGGGVGMAELSEGFVTAFNRYDADGDRSVTRAEVLLRPAMPAPSTMDRDAMRRMMMEEMRRRGGGRGPGGL